MPKTAPANGISRTVETPPGSPGFRKRVLPIIAALIVAAAAFCFWYTRQGTDPGIARYNSGMTLEASGDFKAAERSFLTGIKEDPKYVPCYVQLGALYIHQQRIAEARDVYKRASDLMPNNGQFWFLLGTLDASTGNHADALVEAKRATELMPKDADAEGQYALDLDKAHKIDESYTAYRKAHELQPSNVEFLLTMCKIGLVEPFSVDEFVYQEHELGQYLQANPTDLDAAEMMVQTEERLPSTPDRSASGIKWANQILAARPKDAPIRLALAQMYLSSNRVDDARKTYEAARLAQPDSTDVLHGLLVCYTRLGKTAQAASITAALQQVASHPTPSSKIPTTGSTHS